MNKSRTDLVKMGKYIAYLRKNKKYTQMKLADKLGVTDKTVSKWENGVVAPDITLLVELANVFDVTVDEILGGEKTNNIELRNFFTMEGIKLYLYYSKKKLFKIFLLIISILIFVFFIFLYVNNYYKWEFKTIESNDNKYFISGSYISNKDKSIFIIDKLHYNSNDIGTIKEPEIKEINISLYNGNIELINREEVYEESIFIHESLKSINLKYEGKSLKNKKNDFSIHIYFIDKNNDAYSYKISLK